MALRVGVLLNRRILQKAVRGVRTFERIEYYVEAARELDVELVLFDTAGAQLGLVQQGVLSPEQALAAIRNQLAIYTSTPSPL